MPVKCQLVIEAMEKLAPRHLAAEWDNVGLLLGSPRQEISKILVALDVTDEVVKQALAGSVQLIITHHPFIFNPINHLHTDSYHGDILSRLIKNDIALFAAHTNLDIAAGGVSDLLADKIGLSQIEPLNPYREKFLKLVVYVPETHLEQVRECLFASGAGYIGNYSHCSYQLAGTGTFKPGEGTNPYLGRQGTVEYVAEYRLETILPEKIYPQVLAAMKKAHPYEEVAYDLYSLVGIATRNGLGRIGFLADSRSLAEFACQVKSALTLQAVKIAGSLDKQIRKVALCGGSGADLIQSALNKGCDVLVTGDVKYHEAQTAITNGLAVIDAGHFATERPVVEHIACYLKSCSDQANWQVDVVVDRNSKDVFQVY